MRNVCVCLGQARKAEIPQHFQNSAGLKAHALNDDLMLRCSPGREAEFFNEMLRSNKKKKLQLISKYVYP